ncbi:MAG: hypothetical protein M3P18_24560 [Actinomycetota bacterium]|nr:hypothetical protein [Actinomycetota bacterium]
MESLPEVSSSSPDAAPASPRPLPGGRAVGAFLVILAVLTSILVFTRSTHQAMTPDNQQKQTSTGSSSFALTDKQAIAKFQELNRLRLRLRAYRSRDPSAIGQALASNSPLRSRAYRDITRLRRDHVLDRTHFTTQRLRILVNAPNRVVLRQVELQKPRFVSESGHDLSRSHHAIVVTIDWTLRLNSDLWKIFNSSVVRAHRLSLHK